LIAAIPDNDPWSHSRLAGEWVPTTDRSLVRGDRMLWDGVTEEQYDEVRKIILWGENPVPGGLPGWSSGTGRPTR
jgi:hypothetical protein